MNFDRKRDFIIATVSSATVQSSFICLSVCTETIACGCLSVVVSYNSSCQLRRLQKRSIWTSNKLFHSLNWFLVIKNTRNMSRLLNWKAQVNKIFDLVVVLGTVTGFIGTPSPRELFISLLGTLGNPRQNKAPPLLEIPQKCVRSLPLQFWFTPGNSTWHAISLIDNPGNSIYILNTPVFWFYYFWNSPIITVSTLVS